MSDNSEWIEVIVIFKNAERIKDIMLHDFGIQPDLFARNKPYRLTDKMGKTIKIFGLQSGICILELHNVSDQDMVFNLNSVF